MKEKNNKVTNNKNKDKQVNIFFEEGKTDIMKDIIEELSKCYCENILNPKKLK